MSYTMFVDDDDDDDESSSEEEEDEDDKLQQHYHESMQLQYHVIVQILDSMQGNAFTCVGYIVSLTGREALQKVQYHAKNDNNRINRNNQFLFYSSSKTCRPHIQIGIATCRENDEDTHVYLFKVRAGYYDISRQQHGKKDYWCIVINKNNKTLTKITQEKLDLKSALLAHLKYHRI